MKQGAGALGRRRAEFAMRVVAALVMVSAAACSRGDAAPKGALVPVHLSDFKLEAKVEHVPSGYVTFRVRNTGPSTHEFVVDRTDLPADALPLHKNGITVDEGAKQMQSVGELGEIRLNTTRDLTLELQPGKYVFYCNLEGHYRGGMNGSLEVTG